MILSLDIARCLIKRVYFGWIFGNEIVFFLKRFGKIRISFLQFRRLWLLIPGPVEQIFLIKPVVKILFKNCSRALVSIQLSDGILFLLFNKLWQLSQKLFVTKLERFKTDDKLIPFSFLFLLLKQHVKKVIFLVVKSLNTNMRSILFNDFVDFLVEVLTVDWKNRVRRFEVLSLVGNTYSGFRGIILA